MKYLFRQMLLLIAVVQFGSPLALAHDLVLIPAPPHSLTLEFGHPGEYQPPDAERLIQLDAWFAGDEKPASIDSSLIRTLGNHSILDLQPSGAGRDPEIISGEYDNGYWVTLPGGRHLNTSKLHMPRAIDSGAFIKFGKAIFPSACKNGDFGRKLGLQLELIPMADPFQMRAGKTLPIMVLYQGHPVAGSGVEIGDGKTPMKGEDIPRYTTDDRGIVRLPITHGGLQLIAIDYQTPPATPSLSAHDDYATSLVFMLPAPQP